MMHPRVILAGLLVLVCLSGPAVAGVSTPLALETERELPVNIVADALQYSDARDEITARGNALITQGTLSLRADTITVNLVTRQTEAQGNVLLDQNGDTIACESFSVNLDTQVGVVREATIFIKSENLHITGREVQKTGPDTYTVQGGTITTCDAKNPPWRIDAGRIDVRIEGYAVARHPLLRVKSIPVAYLPALIVPVKTERQSGFLIPKVGHSNRSGWLMENSFFWAINEQSDATFWLDTATRQGIGTGLEYRVKLAEQTHAKLYGYFAGETGSYREDRYRTLFDRDAQRYYFNFEGEHYFDSQMYLKADASGISDRQFYYDYKDIAQRSEGDISRNDARNYDKQESTVFLNKNWDTSNLLVNMNWYRDLREHDQTTVQQLPDILYTTMLRPVGSSPFFYRLEGAYDNYRRHTGQRAERLTMYPQMSMPMLFGRWLRFTPEVGLRGVHFFGLNRTQGDERTGMFPTVNAGLATSFVRVFDLDGERLKKIRHIIEPGLEYEYVARDDQDDYPDFDRPDDYYRRHWAGYYLKNRFSALLRDETGELSEHEIGYLKVGQLFNFAQPRQGLYYEGDRETTSSDFFTELRLDLHRRFYFKTKTYYDNYERQIRRYSILGRFSFATKDFISLEYRYWRDLYEMLEFDAYVTVAPWLALFAATRYDYIENDDYATDFGIEYHAQCWGLRLWYESDGGRDDTHSDSSVKTMFFIKGFGDRALF